MKNDAIRILAVGNSFSTDTFRWLHDLAAGDGVDLTAVNLYIGGCSLQTHWENVCSGARDYLLEVNGVSRERYVSVEETLDSGPWDYILTQQASHYSGMPETYQPYLQKLTAFFRQRCPEAVCLLHKTWAYEQDSDHGSFPEYGCSQQQMYDRLTACYEAAAQSCGLPLVETGTLIQRLRTAAPFRYELGERSLCRDGYHLDLCYGRYLAAASLYTFLTRRDLRCNPFAPPGADPEIMAVIRNCVMDYWGTSESIVCG